MKNLKVVPTTFAKITLVLLVVIGLMQFAISIPSAAALTCGPQNASLPDCQSGGPNINGQTGTSTTNASSTTSSTGACKDTTNAAGDVTPALVQKCLDQSPIVHDLQIIVNFLSAAVGIVVIAVIILGGIQYSLAGDNAQAITTAKQRITNGLIALMAFIFTFAFLQWLIPGGIFK